MKKLGFVLFLFAFAFGIECEAQFSANKHLVHGKPRTDGYQKINKGAFWLKRPEAKLIYEGARPEGYTIIVLNEDCFVRFVDGEHNQNDKNYIVFPKGEVVYSDQSGQLYAAICGNKIELVRPTDFVVEEKVIEEKEEIQQTQSSVASGGKVLDYGGGDEFSKNDSPKPPPPFEVITKEIRERSRFYYWQKKNWWVYPVTGLVVGTATGFFFPKDGYYWYSLLPKPRGTMSDGRAFTNTGTGTQDGGRGD